MIYAPLYVSNFEFLCEERNVTIDYVTREAMQYSWHPEDPTLLDICLELWNDDAEHDLKQFLMRCGDKPITIRRMRKLKYEDGTKGESEEVFHDARLVSMVEEHELNQFANTQIRFEIPSTSISSIQIL